MRGTAARLAALARPVRGWIALSIGLGVITIASSVALAATSAYLIARAALTSDSTQLAVAITSVRLFALLRGSARYAERIVSHAATFRLLGQLRTWFYAAVEPLAPARLSRFHTGDLLTRVIDDVQTLEGFYVRVLIPPLVGLLAAVFASVLLASFQWSLAVVLACGLLVAGVLAPLLHLRMARAPSAAAVDAQARLNEELLDEVEGLPDLMVFDPGGNHQRRAIGTARALGGAQRRLARVRGGGDCGWRSGQWRHSVVGPCAGGRLTSSGNLSGVYLGLVVLVTAAALVVSRACHRRSSSCPRAWRRRVAPSSCWTLPRVRGAGRAAPPCSRGGVNRECGAWASATRAARRCCGASTSSFGRANARPSAGRSGAGKSTIVNVLLRFWDHDAGEITSGGAGWVLSPPTRSGRGASVVSQDSHLFRGTIRDNLFVADAGATDKQWGAYRSGIAGRGHPWPPARANALVGEDGAALSGGERQRVAIARAVLKDAPIFILDEPSASLNPALEAQLAVSLGAYLGRRRPS